MFAQPSITLFFFGIFFFGILGDLTVVDARIPTVNRTVDDTFGDSVTGVRPVFLPAGKVWQSAESCSKEGVAEKCALWPDRSLAFNETWTTARKKPGEEDISITLRFHGTAIYVYFILPKMSALPFVTESNFILDGDPVGYFFHRPTSEPRGFSHLVFSKTELQNKEHSLIISSTEELDYDVFINFDYAIYTTEMEEVTEETTFMPARNPALLSPKFKRQTTTDSPGKNQTGQIVGAVTAIVVFLGIAVAAVYYLRRRYNKKTARARSNGTKERTHWRNDSEASASILPRWTHRESVTFGYQDGQQESEPSNVVYHVDYPSVSQLHVDFDQEIAKKGIHYENVSLDPSPISSSPVVSYSPLHTGNPISIPAHAATLLSSASATASSTSSTANGRSLPLRISSGENRRQSRQLLPAPFPAVEEVTQSVNRRDEEWHETSNERRVSVKTIPRHASNDSWSSAAATLMDQDGDKDEESDEMNLLNWDPGTRKRRAFSVSLYSCGKNEQSTGHHSITVPLNLVLTDTPPNKEFVSKDLSARSPKDGRRGRDNRHTFHTFDGIASIQMLMSNMLASSPKSQYELFEGKFMRGISGSLPSLTNDGTPRTSSRTWGGEPSALFEQELCTQREILLGSEPRSPCRAYKPKIQRRVEQRIMSIEASIHRRILVDKVPYIRSTLTLGMNLEIPLMPATTSSFGAGSHSNLRSTSGLRVLPDTIVGQVTSSSDPLQLFQPHLQYITISGALRLIRWILELVFRYRRIACPTSRCLKDAVEAAKLTRPSRAKVMIYVLKLLVQSLHTKAAQPQVPQASRPLTWYNVVIQRITSTTL
ncbi:hypothetical protein VKT23_011003 [Stygiomarasmius scandens]|uniref:Uncharacterized protein n=1 Tax=Marasmiellus scandens TaxID=2682957 RepID=A0ABR1JEA4_9AGAR